MEINVTLAVLITASMVLLGYSAINSYHYIEDDPRFCKTCHLMEEAWIRWNESPHQGINCHSCHKNDLSSNMRLLITYFTTHPKKLSEEIAEHVEVPNERCEQCHFERAPKWPYVAETIGHKLHLESKVRCLDCHGGRIHRFLPSNEECMKCHSDRNIKVPSMRFHCTQCHNFLVNYKNSSTILPKKQECRYCHKEKKIILVLPMNAHAKSDCGNCHKPHLDIKPLSCDICHKRPETLIHENHKTYDCRTCHTPHKKESLRQICIKCHLTKINHNPDLVCNVCHR